MREIPFINLGYQTKLVEKEVLKNWKKTIKNSSFVLGQDLINFETAFSNYTNIKYSVGVGNGGDALEILLRSIKLNKKSKVFIPVNTFIATATSICRAGFEVKFVDINLEDGLLGIDKLSEYKINSIDCIVPVHLFGSMVDVRTIAENYDYNLKIVEDASQAHGATYLNKAPGTYSLGASYSFYPGKNLGAFGDGGLINTNIASINKSIKLLRNYGSNKKYFHEIIGYNSRLDPVQAIVLSEKLKYLDQWNLMRKKNYEQYFDNLKNLEEVNFLKFSENVQHSFHLTVIKAKFRNQLSSYLNNKGINTLIHYPFPLHKTKAFKSYSYKNNEFKNAEKLSSQILSLPNYPGLKSSEIDYICDNISKFYK
jgi:dTDP-4-amino-4,6-dideoxygalactose transaminase